MAQNAVVLDSFPFANNTFLRDGAAASTSLKEISPTTSVGSTDEAAESQELTEVAQPASNDFLRCERCHYQTKIESLLRAHTAKHLLDSDFQCPNCDFHESNHSLFVDHLATHHTGNTLRCHVCHKKMYKYDLKRHVMVHKAINLYDCSMCEFSTNYVQTIKKHTEAFHFKVHKCSHCALVLTKHELQLHIKAAHDSEHPSPESRAQCAESARKSRQKESEISATTSETAYTGDECSIRESPEESTITKVRSLTTRNMQSSSVETCKDSSKITLMVPTRRSIRISKNGSRCAPAHDRSPEPQLNVNTSNGLKRSSQGSGKEAPNNSTKKGRLTTKNESSLTDGLCSSKAPYCCSSCNYLSAYRSNLIRHTETCHVKKYQCTECNQTMSKYDLVLHMKVSHGVDISRSNPSLGSPAHDRSPNPQLNVNTSKGLKRSSQDSGKEAPNNPNPTKKSSITTKNDLKSSPTDGSCSSKAPYYCSSCNYSSDNRSHVIRHTKAWHYKKCQCTKCDLVMSKHDLVLHMEVSHGVERSRSNPSLGSGHRIPGTPRRGLRIIVNDLKSLPAQDQSSELTVQGKTSHVPQKLSSKQSQYRASSITTKNTSASHNQEISNNDISFVKSACTSVDISHQGFETPKNVQKSVVISQNETHSEMKTILLSAPSEVTLSPCPDNIHSAKLTTAPQNTKTNKWYGHCSKCQYKTMNRGLLIRHTSKHLIDNTFVCPKCGFKEITNLKFSAHLRLHNSKNKVLMCCFCDFKASRRCPMSRHLDVHRPVTFLDCPKCEFSARGHRPDHLRNHIMRLHSKKYHCLICGKRMTKFKLMRHKKSCSQNHNNPVGGIHVTKSPHRNECDDEMDIAIGEHRNSGKSTANELHAQQIVDDRVPPLEDAEGKDQKKCEHCGGTYSKTYIKRHVRKCANKSDGSKNSCKNTPETSVDEPGHVGVSSELLPKKCTNFPGNSQSTKSLSAHMLQVASGFDLLNSDYSGLKKCHVVLNRVKVNGPAKSNSTLLQSKDRSNGLRNLIPDNHCEPIPICETSVCTSPTANESAGISVHRSPADRAKDLQHQTSESHSEAKPVSETTVFKHCIVNEAGATPGSDASTGNVDGDIILAKEHLAITTNPCVSQIRPSETPVQQIDPKESLVKFVKPYLCCSKCTFKTRIKSLLKRHVAKHLIDDRFSCTKCDFKESCSWKFARHWFNHNTDSHMMMKCCFCTVEYTKQSCLKGSLPRHFEGHRVVHLFDCSKCEFSGSDRYKLENHYKKYHIKRHHRAMRGKFMKLKRLSKHSPACSCVRHRLEEPGGSDQVPERQIDFEQVENGSLGKNPSLECADTNVRPPESVTRVCTGPDTNPFCSPGNMDVTEISCTDYIPLSDVSVNVTQNQADAATLDMTFGDIQEEYPCIVCRRWVSLDDFAIHQQLCSTSSNESLVMEPVSVISAGAESTMSNFTRSSGEFSQTNEQYGANYVPSAEFSDLEATETALESDPNSLFRDSSSVGSIPGIKGLVQTNSKRTNLGRDAELSEITSRFNPEETVINISSDSEDSYGSSYSNTEFVRNGNSAPALNFTNVIRDHVKNLFTLPSIDSILTMPR